MASLQQVYAARNPQTPHRAQGLTFESICRRKTALLTIGGLRWKMLGVHGWTTLRAVYLDESACILNRCGEPGTLEKLAELGFLDGSYCAESIIGSCALSLATMPGQPTKTAGEQHFKQALHPWSFCSTPVFDNHGRLFGSISLCCLVEHQSVSDLSLTLAIAREVGNSLLTDSLLAESNRHLNQMYGLLESMDDGVMAWNEQGVLQFLNARAATMLHLDTQASRGKTSMIWSICLPCCVAPLNTPAG